MEWRQTRSGTGGVEQRLATLDLRLQVMLALSRIFQLFFSNSLLLRIQICLLNFARQPFGVAVADTLPEATLDVVVDDLRQTAKLLLDRLGLLHEHFEHAIFERCGKTK